MSTAGYPNRVDLSLEGFSISNSKNEYIVSTELIQFLTLIYNKSHLISIIKPPIHIKLNNVNFEISADPIKSSLKLNKERNIIDLISDGQNLQIQDGYDQDNDDS